MVSARILTMRSARRAIHKMVKDGTLIAIGSGGRGDPYRYAIHPFLKVVIEDPSLKAID